MVKVTTAALAFALASSLILGQDNSTRIPAGSKVYVEKKDGFESYLVAAFQKKKVPLLVVSNREQADFEITGSAETKKAGTAKIIFGSGRSEENASVTVTNIKSGIVAYASSSHKKDSWHGKKSTAEAIALSIKSKIEEGK